LEDLDEYSKVMRGCLTRRLWRKALKVWEELRWMGLQPKVKQYMWAMKAHSAGSQWEASLAILDELRADDIPEDMGTFMHALMAAKEGKNWELSVNLLNSMSDQQVIPDVGVYNAVLGACDRDQNWPAAELVYKDMQHWGLLPDKITYNTLISASSWAAEEEKGAVLPFDFHEEMKDKVGSDFKAVTTLITACGRWGLWEQALDSLREDQKKRVYEDEDVPGDVGLFQGEPVADCSGLDRGDAEIVERQTGPFRSEQSHRGLRDWRFVAGGSAQLRWDEELHRDSRGRSVLEDNFCLREG